MKTKETNPDFIISGDWKQKLIDNPQMLDCYLRNAEKMRDDIIDRAAKLTERGYKFIEFMLLIAAIISAIGINAASGLAKIVLAAILVCFLIVCLLSFFLLRSNKVFYKGYAPEDALRKDIFDWIQGEYSDSEQSYKLFELEVCNKDIRHGACLNERMFKRLEVVKISLLIVLSLILILTAICAIF